MFNEHPATLHLIEYVGRETHSNAPMGERQLLYYAAFRPERLTMSREDAHESLVTQRGPRMIRRSLRWKPLGAYGYFAAVLSGWGTLGILGVFFVRNPATAVWGLVAAPLYFLAIFLVTAIVALVIVAVRMPLDRVREGWRHVVLALPAGLAGIAIAHVFWWCIEFEAPPVWVVVAGVVATAMAFGWYVRCYEGSTKAPRPRHTNARR